MRTDDVCNQCEPLVRSMWTGDWQDDVVVQFRTAIHDQLYSRKERHGASLVYIVDGRPSKLGYGAFSTFKPTSNINILLMGHDMDAPWDFDVPTKLIEIYPGGLGFINHIRYDSFSIRKWDDSKYIRTRCMFRAYVSKAFKPKRKGIIGEDQVLTFKREFIPELGTPNDVFKEAIDRGVIPLEIRLIAYAKKRRHAYRLDLASDTLLMDVRAGRLPIHAYRVRPAVLYPMFDKVLVSLDVPDITRNMFEMIFESDRLTLNELSASLGITRLTAQNNLAALVTRGLVGEERVHHETIYYVNLSAITGVALDDESTE